MICEVPTKESIKNELQKIIDKNVFEILNHSNITKMRDEFHQIIIKAQTYNIDISTLFPIVTEGGPCKVTFYYDGRVRMSNPYEGTITLHDIYGSDSLCQDK